MFRREQAKWSQCPNNRNHRTLATVCKVEFFKSSILWKVKTWRALKHIVANVSSAIIEQNIKTTGSLSRMLLTVQVQSNLDKMLLFQYSGLVASTSYYVVLISFPEIVLICGEYIWKLWESHSSPSLVKLLSGVIFVHLDTIILMLQCSVLLKITGRVWKERGNDSWHGRWERKDDSRSDSLKEETGWGRETSLVIPFQT